jgi:hypothetical protein
MPFECSCIGKGDGLRERGRVDEAVAFGVIAYECSCVCNGDCSRDEGREVETLALGSIDGDRSGSADERGETPRDEDRDADDVGRDKEPWFLTAVACVRNGFVLRGTLPSRGGVWGIAGADWPASVARRATEAGDTASLCAWKGFRQTVFCFLGADVGLLIGEDPASTIGLVVSRLTGTKSSLRSSTKFDGNSPTARLSRRNRPIHHCPSPAFKHSIKSPSTNPRSRVVSPPQEYTARHQHGKRTGS